MCIKKEVYIEISVVSVAFAYKNKHIRCAAVDLKNYATTVAFSVKLYRCIPVEL